MDWTAIFTAIKPIAAQGTRDGLRLIGMGLATHGFVQNGAGVEAFVGAGMTLAGLFWGWFTTSGYMQVGALLKKVTAQRTQANAVEAAKALAPGAAVDTTLKTNTFKAVTNILLIAFVLSAFLAGGAQAQVKRPQITGNIVEDTKANLGVGQPAASSGVKLTGDPVVDLQTAITKGGQKLIMNLKQSYALAMAKNAAGASADNTSATCTKALVPIVDLVVNGPKAGTVAADDPMALTADEQAMASDAAQPEGIIVKIEKARILRLSLQSPALNDACGALVQDEVKNAQGLVGKITSLVTGAGMAGFGL